MDANKAEGDFAVSNDVAGYESLYRQHRDWVFKVAYRFTGNRDDSLDVLQEVFIYLLNRFPTLELRANLRTFLYPAIKHISLGIKKKKGRTVSIDGMLEEPAKVVITEHTSELVAALECLAPDIQEVIILRFVDDMSIDEIAESLEVPAGTVKSRLYRALQHLRNSPQTQKYFFVMGQLWVEGARLG